MWTRAENGEGVKPPAKEDSGGTVILRRDYTKVAATDEMPEHWEYDEWQMSIDQYEIYQYYESQIADQSDALIELAELISEVM